MPLVPVRSFGGSYSYHCTHTDTYQCQLPPCALCVAYYTVATHHTGLCIYIYKQKQIARLTEFLILSHGGHCTLVCNWWFSLSSVASRCPQGHTLNIKLVVSGLPFICVCLCLFIIISGHGTSSSTRWAQRLVIFLLPVLH